MEKIINIHVEKLPEGVYLATSDDIQGLVAQGRTIWETLEIARDVARKLLSFCPWPNQPNRREMEMTMTTKKPFFIRAEWDEEARVWVATSEDVPGLATEAETVEDLIEKLRGLIPELLEANGISLDQEVPFEVLSRRFESAPPQHTEAFNGWFYAWVEEILAGGMRVADSIERARAITRFGTVLLPMFVSWLTKKSDHDTPQMRF
jgi:predicted RNase H-like HicB family nuclease